MHSIFEYAIIIYNTMLMVLAYKDKLVILKLIFLKYIGTIYQVNVLNKNIIMHFNILLCMVKLFQNKYIPPNPQCSTPHPFILLS